MQENLSHDSPESGLSGARYPLWRCVMTRESEVLSPEP